jgi:hypothetical protein
LDTSTLEDENSTLSQNIKKSNTHDLASHPRRKDTSDDKENAST